MEMEIEDRVEIEDKVRTWGQRLVVPARVLRALELRAGDEVVWEISEEQGEAILRRKKK